MTYAQSNLQNNLSSSENISSPKGMNYQAVVRNDKGELMSHSRLIIKVDILSGSLVEYSETQVVQTDALGQCSMIIGNGDAVTGKMSDINWNQGDKYIQLSVDADKSGNYTYMGKALY